MVLRYDDMHINELEDALKSVALACDFLNVDFYIVGAIARNVWLQKGKQKLVGTSDIDIAVLVPDHKTYDELKQVLIQQYNFSEIKTNAFGLRNKNEAQIDLMPFGNIETNDEIVFKKPFTKIKVQGFKEVYSNGTIETVFEENKYSLATIEGIVILKLIAFDDNQQRIKDIKDLALICKYYWDLESEVIYEEYLDLFGLDYDIRQIAWIVLGRQMRKIIASNNDLLLRISTIIDKAINLETKLTSYMITDSLNETIDEKIDILTHIKIGLNSKS